MAHGKGSAIQAWCGISGARRWGLERRRYGLLVQLFPFRLWVSLILSRCLQIAKKPHQQHYGDYLDIKRYISH